MSANIRRWSRNRRDNLIILVLSVVGLTLFYTYWTYDDVAVNVEFEQLMAQRRDRLRLGCIKSEVGDTPATRDSVMHYYAYILQDWKLFWCPVYKAASTGWFYNLLHLKGIEESDLTLIEELYGKDQPSVMARSQIPLFTKANYMDYLRNTKLTSLLIIRHPWARLVSAFKDKFERFQHKYYVEYGKSIVSTFRKVASEKFPADCFPETVPVQYGVEDNFIQWTPPIFWEFIQHIMANSHNLLLLDEHWRPMHHICEVCRYDYDYILCVENLAHEQQMFVKVINAQHILTSEKMSQKLHQSLSQHDISHYFDMLEDEEVDLLHKIYHRDFELFGYTPEQYYSRH